MKVWKLALGLGAVVALGPGARAEAVLESAGWQSARRGPVNGARWEDAQTAAGGALLRGKATLKNRGPKPAEPLVLRYAMAARLVKKDGSGEGAWGVPFLVDHTRVAKIPPNQVISVPLMNPVVDLYLRRMARHGLRAAALKVQVMIEPRDGAEPAVVENVLELK